MIWSGPVENLAKTSFGTIIQAHLVAPIIILAWNATANVIVKATFYRVFTHHLPAVWEKYYGNNNKEKRLKSHFCHHSTLEKLLLLGIILLPLFALMVWHINSVNFRPS
jgi:hypothetical protein